MKMNPDTTKTPIGGQIKMIRNALGMTQTQLAGRCGMQQSVIADIESGKRHDLCWSTVQKVGEGLNCHSFIHLSLQQDIGTILDEKSTKLAQEIIAASSGSTAIEKQLPSQSVIDHELEKIKQDILKHHKSAIWDVV